MIKVVKTKSEGDICHMKLQIMSQEIFFLSLVQDSLNLKYKYFLIFKEAQYE